MITEYALREFIAESNKIEGIFNSSEKTSGDASWMKMWIEEEVPSPGWLSSFVSRFQPDAVLRNREGLDVYIGDHVPPAGGEKIAYLLDHLLTMAKDRRDPYSLHQDYESLHPFTDGNGRSGRALWLWQMVNQRGYEGEIQFLHMYYYQGLQRNSTPINSF